MTKEKDLHFILIPNEILYCSKITANAKLLFGEIMSLCNKNDKGCCWASNNYFAELYKVSVTSISLWISSLTENKFIKCDVNHKKNTRKIYLKTSLSKLKDNIPKGIYRQQHFRDAAAIDDFNIESSEWIDEQGVKHRTDSIDYES